LGSDEALAKSSRRQRCAALAELIGDGTNADEANNAVSRSKQLTLFSLRRNQGPD